MIIVATLFAALAGTLSFDAGLGGAVPTGTDTGMSTHGLIALVLGLVGSLAVAGGLLALAFHSARSGHDARAAEPPEDA